MISYNLIDNGECSYKIEWLGKKPKMTMMNLYRLYKDMKFISTCGRSSQYVEFGKDLEKALQNDLGADYKVKINIGHFAVSGFVSKDNKYVYFSVEDLRDSDNGFEDCLYRTATDDKDYRGGSNHFCSLYELADNIKKCIERS